MGHLKNFAVSAITTAIVVAVIFRVQQVRQIVTGA